ncbi:Concanavalin A-like lectin/glucanases superfamily protein [Candidatus Bilamarchaeum dharawalense]|uniref:Concanavalin A-like lectin/glucanases superfamily protein n=1 Tax=Candidatus Bilamarchaeum dharawalense TaxID=2885759 RepID=A0A5E4LQK6_9ARCH|nr:Concanavalin A-like lectin/glucanases superfamily protein [Candidatus Bilamarchaeum dharawalense]
MTRNTGTGNISQFTFLSVVLLLPILLSNFFPFLALVGPDGACEASPIQNFEFTDDGTFLEVPHSDVLEPDFSNVLVKFVGPDCNPIVINHSIALISNGEWAVLKLERGLSPNETVYLTTMDPNLSENNSTPEIIVDFAPDPAPGDPITQVGEVLISFAPPTLADGTITSNRNIVVNVSANLTTPLSQFKWYFSGTNYSLFDSNLVTMFNFDNVAAIGDTSTKVVDLSTNGKNGTCYSSPETYPGTITPCTFVSGKYGSAISFDGNAYVEFNLNTNPSVMPDTTWVIWVYPTTINHGTRQTIISNDDGGHDRTIIIESGTSNFAVFTGGGAYQTVSVTQNAWQQIAVVYHSDHTISFYKNGVSYAVPDTWSGQSSVWTLTHIGSNPSYPHERFHGYLDEPQIYNRALSSAEISQLYLTNLNKYNTNNWAFNYSQTNAAYGTYNYSACAKDSALNELCTELRTLTLASNTAPVVSNVLLTSTYGTNLSSENLTVNFDIYDEQSDSVKNITDWRKWTGSSFNSIAILNMPFENGSSNSTWTKDYSTYGNNGTVSGATWSATGGYDGKGAYSFDGNDYINLSNPTSLNSLGVGPSTWSMWFKTSTNGDLLYKADGNTHMDGWWIDVRGGDEVGIAIERFNINTRKYVSFTPSGTWNHLVVTWDGVLASSGIKIYLNGVEGTYTTSDDGVGPHESDAAYPFYVGYGGGGSSGYLNGLIDEIRVYDYVLSPQQIQAIYNNRTNLIVSQELSDGQVWQACVTPNDGKTDGSTVCSNSLTILSISTGYEFNFTSSSVSNSSAFENTEIIYNGTLNATIPSATSLTIDLLVDGVSVNSTILSLSSNGTTNVSLGWDAVRGNHTLTLYADYPNSYSESNESNNNISANVSIYAPSVVSIVSPTDSSHWVRGANNPDEDILDKVDSTTVFLAQVYNPDNPLEHVDAICSFYTDGVFAGYNTTNGTNFCSYTLDHSLASPGSHQLFINYSLLDDNFAILINNSTATIILDVLTSTVTPLNERLSGHYMSGDAIITQISTFNNSVPFEPYNFEIFIAPNNAQCSDVFANRDLAWSIVSKADAISSPSTGVYILNSPSNSSFDPAYDIHWCLYVNDSSNYISTATHSDVGLDPATSNLTLLASNATNETLPSYHILLYDRNGYVLENETLNSVLSRPAAQYDNYSIYFWDNSGNLIKFEDINLTSENVTINPMFVPDYSGSLPLNATYGITGLIYVENSSFFDSSGGYANISLSKNGINTRRLYECANYDPLTQNCTSWSQFAGYTGYGENSTHLWFIATSFSGYAGGPDGSNLTIWDPSDFGYYGYQGILSTGQSVKFYANYSSPTNHPINDSLDFGQCRISFADSSNQSMQYNSSLGYYVYSRTFSSSGSYSWNVTCNSSGYFSLFASDGISIIKAVNPPAIHNITFAPSSPYNTQSVSLLFNVTSDDDITGHVNCSINSSSPDILPQNNSELAGSNVSFSFTLGMLSVATHYINLTCVDGHGTNHTITSITVNLEPTDLIFPEDGLTFTNDNPSPGGPTIPIIRVLNNGTSNASDVVVYIFVDGIYDQSLSFDSINSGATEEQYGSSPITIGTTGYHIIKAVVDPLNAISETNDLNNEISRSIEVGMVLSRSLINISNVWPHVGPGSTIYTGDQFWVYGHAYYDLNDSPPVQGGRVTVTINGTTNGGYTNDEGNFDLGWFRLWTSGDYPIEINVTDVNVYGDSNISLVRIYDPIGCVYPHNMTDLGTSPMTHVTFSTPPVVGRPTTAYVNYGNGYCGENGTSPGIQAPYVIVSLYNKGPGGNEDITIGTANNTQNLSDNQATSQSFVWIPPQIGYTYLKSVVNEGLFIPGQIYVPEYYTSNNIQITRFRVYPDQPDLSLNLEFFQEPIPERYGSRSTVFLDRLVKHKVFITNDGGDNATSINLTLYDNGVPFNSSIVSVNAITTSEFIIYHAYDVVGGHVITANVSLIGQTDYNPTNDNRSRPLTVADKPDLEIYAHSQEPEGVYVDGFLRSPANISVNLTIRNFGSATAYGPFNITIYERYNTSKYTTVQYDGDIPGNYGQITLTNIKVTDFGVGPHYIIGLADSGTNFLDVLNGLSYGAFDEVYEGDVFNDWYDHLDNLHQLTDFTVYSGDPILRLRFTSYCNIDQFVFNPAGCRVYVDNIGSGLANSVDVNMWHTHPNGTEVYVSTYTTGDILPGHSYYFDPYFIPVTPGYNWFKANLSSSQTGQNLEAIETFRIRHPDMLITVDDVDTNDFYVPIGRDINITVVVHNLDPATAYNVTLNFSINDTQIDTYLFGTVPAGGSSYLLIPYTPDFEGPHVSQFIVNDRWKMYEGSWMNGYPKDWDNTASKALISAYNSSKVTVPLITFDDSILPPVLSGTKFFQANIIDYDNSTDIFTAHFHYYPYGDPSSLTSMFSAHPALSGNVSLPIGADFGADFDTHLIPDGLYYFYVNTTDFNASSNDTSDLYIVDNTPPNIQLHKPDNDAHFTNPNIHFNYTPTDNLQSPILCQLYVDGSLLGDPTSVVNNSVESYDSTISVGSHTWYVSCSDGYNDNASVTRNFVVDAPTLEVIQNSPANDTNFTTSTIEFNFTEISNSAEFANCSIFIDAILTDTNSSTQNNTPTLFTVPSIPDGYHNWSVSCNDSNAQASSSNRSFMVDTTPPLINLMTPANNLHLSMGDVSFTFNATDNLAPILDCTSYLEDVSVYTNTSTQNNTPASFSVPDLYPGIYHWYTNCSDGHNLNTSETWTFTIDPPPIYVQLLSPPNGSSFESIQPFTFKFVDMNYLLANCSMYLDGVFAALNSSAMNNTITTFSIPTLSQTTHSWYVNCSDLLVSNVSETWVFTLRSNPPEEHYPLHLDRSSVCDLQTRVVTIKVTDAGYGYPLPGARVSVLDQETKYADGNGVALFEFDARQSATYQLEASYSDYDPYGPVNLDVPVCPLPVECISNDDCGENGCCSNGVCTQIEQGSCGYQNGCSWIPYECCGNQDCTGAVCANHICVPPECEDNSDCSYNEYCAAGNCIPLGCGNCSYLENHSCMNFICCYDSDCKTNEKCVDHSCLFITSNQTINQTTHQIIEEPEKPVITGDDRICWALIILLLLISAYIIYRRIGPKGKVPISKTVAKKTAEHPSDKMPTNVK